MQEDGQLTIELVATRDLYGGPAPTMSVGRQVTEPSFDVSLSGPSGKVIPNI